jgi:Ulp1 family protease
MNKKEPIDLIYDTDTDSTKEPIDLIYDTDTDSTKSHHAVKDEVQIFLFNTDFVKYFQIKDTEYDIAQNISILNSFFERYRSTQNSLCGKKLFCSELHRLAPTKWLELFIITTFFYLLNKEQNYLNKRRSKKYFFTDEIFIYMDRSAECKDLLRLFKKINIFEYEYVLFPCYHDYHFTLLVVDFRKNVIKYYDSLYDNSEFSYATKAMNFVSDVINQIQICWT